MSAADSEDLASLTKPSISCAWASCAAHARGRGHAVDGLDRRRILALGLAQHIALGGLEHHGGFRAIERERRCLLGLACPPVELAGDGAIEQVARARLELLIGNHGVDHAGGQCGFCAPRLAVGDPFDGVVGADQARCAYGAAETRIEAQPALGKADLCGLAHDAIIGGQTHLQTAAEGRTVDRGHAWTVQVLDPGKHGVGFVHPGLDPGRVGLEALTEFHDVRADDERRFGRTDQDTADIRILRQRVGGAAEIVNRGLVELVDRAVVGVETQHGDAVGHRDG